MKNKLNNCGYTFTAVILVLLTAGTIIGTGYFVYSSNQNSDNTLTSKSDSPDTPKVNKSRSTVKAVAAVDPVLYKSEDGVAYQIDLLATTPDQKAQGNAISAFCRINSVSFDAATSTHAVVGATGTIELFLATPQGKQNYKAQGNFAIINAGCYDKTLGGNQFGGGASHYLQKKAGTWTVLTASQSGIGCVTVDGTGIPASLVATCFAADGTERAIKQ